MKIPRAVVPIAVDEDCRRAAHAVAPPVGDIFEDALPRGLIADVLLELVHVEAQRAHELEQLRFRYRRLAVVEPVVHLPELSLPGRGLRDPRRELRARMCTLVRNMPIDELKPRAQHAA